MRARIPLSSFVNDEIQSALCLTRYVYIYTCMYLVNNTELMNEFLYIFIKKLNFDTPSENTSNSGEKNLKVNFNIIKLSVN